MANWARPLFGAALLLSMLAAPFAARAQQQVSGCVESFTNGVLGGRTCAPWTPMLLNAIAGTVVKVKGSAGLLGTVYCYNPGGAVAYLQIFDVATAAGVTLGTTAPKLSLGIPSTLASGLGPAFVGIEFLAGIQVASTTTVNGNTGSSMDCNVTYN